MGALFSVLTGKLSARTPRRDCAVFIAAAALALGCFLVGFRAAAQVPTGAHILAGPDLGRISATSVTVTWTTDKSKVGEVVWGPKAGKYDRKIQEGLPAADHSLTLTGLIRNTTYHFKVKTGSAKSKDGTFTTANYSDAPFTFADMGDNRGATHDTDMRSVTPSFQNIVNAAVLKAPAFTVHVGDFFHGPGTPSQMTTMYSVFKTAIQPLVNASSSAPYPFTISPGNHEMSPCHPPCPPSQQFDTNALFNLEMPNQPQNGPEGYVGTCFSFDYGNTHVASIDTNRYDGSSTNSDFNFWNLSDREIDWLDQDLAIAQSHHVRHIFVFGHGQPWSPDGVEWTSATSGTQSDIYAVQDMVAVGASGTILTSQDATNWTPAASGTTVTLRAVADVSATEAMAGIVVVVGDSGTILRSTDLGTTWARSTSGTTRDLNGLVVNESAPSGSLFVAVGDGGTILTSSDGTAWAAAASNTSQDLTAVTEYALGSQSLYLAVGKHGTVLTSNDGSIWTARTSATTADLYGAASGIISGQPMFTAVGASGTVVTSLNGVTWTSQNSGVGADLNGVVSDFMFIAAGDAGTVLISNDGAEWVRQDAHSTADLLGIGHLKSDDLHVSSYFASGVGGAILLSPMWMGDSSPANYQSQRDKFWRVLASHGVEAYLCGHVHTFNDDYTVDGVTQWVCGNSGSTGVGNGRWTLWSIDGEWATAQLLDEDGNVTYIRSFQSRQP